MSENEILNSRGTEFKTYNEHKVVKMLEPGVYVPRNKKLVHRLHLRSHQTTSRAVKKTGEFNIEKIDTNTTFSILSSWFVAMVEVRWRMTLLFFFTAFTVNWLTFATIYWIISYLHEDLVFEHLPQNQEKNNWTACIENIHGFTSTFLFSVEVHTTVAYGKRAITLECPEAIFIMCMQCIISSIFQCFMVGILFAKLTRPKSRTQTILFSKHAVVCLRNDKLCLLFRVGDMRKSRILNIKFSMYLLKNSEEDNINEQIELLSEIDGCESTFFLWPVTVIHEIDKFSPFYDISAADLLCGKFEIISVFEGVIETTGQPVQAISSFAESEILWGHSFVPMIGFMTEKEVYDVDFSKLNETLQIETPLCSAAEYDFIKSVTDFSDIK